MWIFSEKLCSENDYEEKFQNSELRQRIKKKLPVKKFVAFPPVFTNKLQFIVAPIIIPTARWLKMKRNFSDKKNI